MPYKSGAHNYAPNTCGVGTTQHELSAGKPHVRTQWETVKKEKHALDKCVKNRCEPCHIRQVLEVVGAVHGVDDLDALAATLHVNTCRVFFPATAAT